MKLFGLFNIVNKIADITQALPPDAKLIDVEARRDAVYFKRILKVAGGLAAIGGAFGLIVLVIEANKPTGRSTDVLVAPVLFAIGGFTYGTAVMCLIAPTTFLSGPIGAPWMKLIGVQNPLGARAVCFLLLLLTTLIIGWILMTSARLF